MNKNEHVIIHVEKGSSADKAGIKVQDRILSINQSEIVDVFDYHYLCNEEQLDLVIEKPDGTRKKIEIKKEYEEDLGLTFESGLMDEYRSCCNKCIFCFIDQMPKGMRDTLYFKDDDSRLSFLQGNYITLTNMNERDVDRIIQYKMGPINISVQTMNPTLRCEMLHNRFAGEALNKMRKFLDAGIPMNGQIVLCKGVNDGKELKYSLEQLMEYAPVMESISVVPVGLSKYREGLYPLEPFTREDAKEVLECIREFQNEAFARHGIHFVHASDEWYLLANEPIPLEENYDGYLQLENGVGMLRLLMNEVEETLSQKRIRKPIFHRKRKITIATGLLASEVIQLLVKQVMNQYPYIQVQVNPIVNDFFGPMITVSGLITGQDLINQLKGKDLGQELLLPVNMLRSGERVFLDDQTVEDVEKECGVTIRIVENTGYDFVSSIVG